MSGLRRELTLLDGCVLAIGSIAGSGILFLPSLTYALAGPDVLLVWLGSTLLCFPMLFMFSDMVKSVPDGSGIEGFIGRGLGPRVASSVPILFLALVSIGIPAGSLVAGQYLANLLGAGAGVQLASALVIIGIATAVNLVGVKTGARIQGIITWSLLAIATLICVLAYPYAKSSYGTIRPAFSQAQPVLSGIVVAFWAYAGFENLTFIAGEFRNPRRDFLLAMCIAFVVYGGLAITLTANVAAIIPRAQLSEVAGLFQLADTIEPRWLTTGGITVFALALMQINANSWLWGVSRLVYTSAGAHHLPSAFSALNGKQLPVRAILTLSAVFTFVTVLFSLFPALQVEALVIASVVFMFLYALCFVSYIKAEGRSIKAFAAALVFVFLLATLWTSGWRVAYPIVVFLGAVFAASRRHKGRRAWSAEVTKPTSSL